MNRHLIVLRAGAAEPLIEAINRLAAPEHDIAISWDGAEAPVVPGAAFVHACPGPRWPALARALGAHAAQVGTYRLVWLPDAGVRGGAADAARLFAVCEQVGLELAQPAFAPAAGGTHPDVRPDVHPDVHPIALRHAGFQLRFTDFVDPAAPVFSSALLAQALPGFAAGRDLGHAWPRLARPGRVAIVDTAPMARDAAAAAPEPGNLPAVNLGGLLDDGDGLCLGGPAAVDALVAALFEGCRGGGLDPARLTRYLAAHLQVPGSAGMRETLERELADSGMQFNAGLADDAAAPPAEAAPAPVAPPAASRELALLQADLADLRERHAALQDERDRQGALLAELARALRSLPGSPGALAPSPVLQARAA